ncbi:response regulator [Chondrinema litorale]|uniref:response regulator n=1 Tax=Chondrinema litorale TaxID=2994555 RepID=UPI002542B63B|nr:response regulator [Chondrinema litorale]UZR98692.1 response regulator [Chondrinema litorale]
MNNNNYLVIDDSEIDVLIVNRMIEKSYPNLNAIALTDGSKGISYLRKMAEGSKEKPRFVLLDLQMPLMDGFEFLEIYEKEFFQKYPDIKIIILTSSIHLIDKKKAEKYRSVSAYMVKPFSLEEFKYFI